jgi:mpaB/rubber oxygenase-like protein
MIESRWSDDRFLDSLRRQTDPLADSTVAALEREGGIAAVNRLFGTLHADERAIPEDAPEPFREFVVATRAPLSDLNPKRLDQGGAVFLRHGFSSAVVLLLASLPAGYSAPCLSRILSVSGDLGAHPYKRLMGVLQLLVDISQARAFRPGGAAAVAAQKMRLLHAGVRRVVPSHRPGYSEKYGPVVNHEDMLATIMGFSWLVIHGLRTLGAGLKPQEEEDFYYLWHSFARMMGIHPEGQPQDASMVPATVAEAGEFYTAYTRRHYVGAEANPDGVALSRINLAMVKSLVPWWARLLGLGVLPRLLMTELLGDEGMRRVDIRPVSGHRFLGASFSRLLRVFQDISDHCPRHLGEQLGRLVFQDMIDVSRGGEVNFLVPDSLAAMRELA